MKKWLLILSVFLIVLLGVFVTVYFNAVEPVKAAEEKAVVIAKRETSLQTAEDFYLYHGSKTYYVVKGKSESNQDIVVWIPEKKGPIIVKREQDGVSKKEAIQKLYNEKNPSEVISVRLGMENNIPLWEIYYRTNNDAINYYYVNYSTGEWLKDIENL